MLRVLFGILFTWTLSFSLSAQEFAFYKSNSPNRLNQAFVYDIDTDEQGVKWFATGDGVLRKTLNTDSIFRYSQALEHSNFATAIFCNKKSVWIGYYDGSVGSIVNGELKSPTIKVDGQVIGIKQEKELLYIATNNGVFKQQIGSESSKAIFSNHGQLYDFTIIDEKIIACTEQGVFSYLEEEKKLSNTKIFKLIASKNETLGIGEKSLYTIEASSLSKKIDFDSQQHSFVIKDIVYLDGLDQYLVAANEGLLELKQEGKNWVLKETKGRINQLETAVYSLHKANNTVWIGSYGEGIWYCRPEAAPMWFENLEDFKSTQSIWAAKKKNESIVYGPQGPRKTTAAIKSGAKEKLCVYKDEAYGISESSLRKISSEPQSWRFNKAVGEISDFGFISDSIIYVTGRLSGVSFYHFPSLKKIKTLNTGNGLLHNDISQVLQGNENELWLLSRKAGICLLKNLDIVRYFTQVDGLPSLENTAITLFQNELWISSEGGGIAVIDRNKVCHQVRLVTGESPEYYYGLGSNKERLVIYSREELIDLYKGVKSVYQLPSFSKTVVPSEGPVHFTANGYVVPCYKGILFIPKEQFDEENISSISISSIESDIAGSIASGTEIETGKHEISLRFELNGDNPLTVADYDYQLLGYHNNWVKLDHAAISLPSVRYGDYELKVRNDKEIISLLVFSVAAPFWRSPIFLALLFIGLILLYLALVKWKTYRLKQRNLELENTVADRTKDLAKKNEELQQFTYAISHDLKNPAANIKELVSALKEDFPDLDEDLMFYMTQLDKASGKLYQNLIDLLEVLKHANSGELPTEQVDIAEIIQDIRDKISGTIAKNNAQIIVDLKDFKSLEYNKVNLGSIVYNLISNGIKYRRLDVEPVVEISTFISDKHRGIEIKDNGLGMDLSKNKDTLFGLFQRFHSHVEGSGVGLYLVNSIIEKNGGFIELESSPGNGSTFKLHLVPISSEAPPH